MNALIIDHLTKMGLQKSASMIKVNLHTFTILQDELLANQKAQQAAKKSGRSTGPQGGTQQHDPNVLLNKLSQFFDAGQKADYFAIWDKLIPKTLKDSNYDCKKLEFNLHIYFVIYVVHPYNKNR